MQRTHRGAVADRWADGFVCLQVPNPLERGYVARGDGPRQKPPEGATIRQAGDQWQSTTEHRTRVLKWLHAIHDVLSKRLDKIDGRLDELDRQVGECAPKIGEITIEGAIDEIPSVILGAYEIGL